MWKCYLQRQRRWHMLAAETAFATVLFIIALVIAYPVFLTPLQAEPEPPLTTADLLASLKQGSIVGYTPDGNPYAAIMDRAAAKLAISFMSASSEFQLNSNLYRVVNRSATRMTDVSVIWVIWLPKIENTWRFSIRSTERARYETNNEYTTYPNPHLRAGFLAVQVAVSEAILEESAPLVDHEVKLVSMPVSPLMKEDEVKRAVTIILLCFTVALIPPVLETQALVVNETNCRFKRALRLRGVSYSSMYLGWLVFAYMTALPICFVASIAMLLIFRWVHLFVALTLLLVYISAMFITALIMAMFHSKAWIACIWSSLYTLLQTYMAELLVHHEYDMLHGALTFLLHLMMPPLGLVHAINHFALLSTGKKQNVTSSLWYSFGSWAVLIIIYFTLLMILQRTIGHERAIGGQVSWKSIFFQKVEDVNALHNIENPTGKERDKLQEVDELIAKAVSFRNVSKSIMGVEVLKNITLDIYRGEFTMLFAERVQEKMISTAEDLLTGLTFPEEGTINVLGTELKYGVNLMTEPHMMGFCHRSTVLVGDLTISEYFTLFTEICLWKECRNYMYQYSMMRISRLLKECNLEGVQHLRVRQLDTYYRAQLCWALAMLMEPRVVVIPNFSDQHPRHNAVIKDKIMQYKKYVTIIEMCFSSLQLEYADRVFVFDSKVIAFGGTPAYMFFKFGREYRVRMTIPTDLKQNEEFMRELIQRATEAGGSVRAHIGSLLIFRIPTEPTATIAKLVQDLKDNANRYGIMSINISVPDSEEVYRRAMVESRAELYQVNENQDTVKKALKRIAEPPTWKRRKVNFINLTQVKHIGWKYFAFHCNFKLYFIITLLSAILAGIFIGLSLSKLLTRRERDEASKKLIHGELLTMEYTKVPTSLVLRVDNNATSISVANAYVLSEPNSTEYDIAPISYTALAVTESLTEYLVTRAIDSPQIYVSLFAYGLDVKTNISGKILANALYSPLHKDHGSAARSLAKVYTSLLRHYTDDLDASIRVVDDPLTLDLTPWMTLANKPPLFVQFLLIIVISHIVLLPSKENGFIRHNQIHALNFSPTRYWLTLFLWDVVLYLFLVLVMTTLMLLIIYLVAPTGNFLYLDLVIVPLVLLLYGFACIPQAYLFSLGPRVALNSMTFIIVNIVFGETTIIAQTFYGEVLDYALLLMSLSPQFNMAYAFVKIKQIFLYNSECLVFKTKNLCTGKMLHKCCKKCGVLQKCFEKQSYLSWKPGIFTEIIALASVTLLYTIILLVLEYKMLQRLWLWWHTPLVAAPASLEPAGPGALREREQAHIKWAQLEFSSKGRRPTNPYGEYLLACDLTRREMGIYTTYGVSLGVSKGEALAISGLKRHGREKLLELLAGYKFPYGGQAVCMSKWNLRNDSHKYACHVSLSCEHDSLPPWMTARHALWLLALLRGLPAKQIRRELDNIIQALEMQDQASTLISNITSKPDRARLSFAAAIIGAPPVIIIDECTVHQKNSVRSSMYYILHCLRSRGHAIITSASSVEAHLPVTNRLAFILDGSIFDVDYVDELVARYSRPGYTAVLHLKDEVDVDAMFQRHFNHFVINDTSEVLVNVQILDENLDWATIFQRMEDLKKTNQQVYSYIVTAIPIDYIYNSVINNEKGNRVAADLVCWIFRKRFKESQIQPKKELIQALRPFEQKYDITRLKELPWSVIFHT